MFLQRKNILKAFDQEKTKWFGTQNSEFVRHLIVEEFDSKMYSFFFKTKCPYKGCRINHVWEFIVVRHQGTQSMNLSSCGQPYNTAFTFRLHFQKPNNYQSLVYWVLLMSCCPSAALYLCSGCIFSASQTFIKIEQLNKLEFLCNIATTVKWNSRVTFDKF